MTHDPLVIADLLAELLQCGVVTGSRRWALNDEMSDLDIVIIKSHFDALDAKLRKADMRFFEMSGSSQEKEDMPNRCGCNYTAFFGLQVNLIVPESTQEYFVWCKASAAMDKYVSTFGKGDVWDRDTRVKLFQEYKEQLRAGKKLPAEPLRMMNHKAPDSTPDEDLPF